MNHVLICGAAGFTNRGDDALLWGMLRQLQTVAGERPLKVVGGPELPALIAPFGATALPYDDRPELARALEDADLVVLGGGGMLYDGDYDATLARFLTDPPDRQWLYELAKLTAAARAASRPVMLYAMGAGPLFSDAARKVARFLGESAQALTVRDRASADLLGECGLSPARVQLAADPAVLLEAASEEAVQHWLTAQGLASAPRPWIGLNLRPWYRFMGVETGEGKREQLETACGEMIRALRTRLGATVVLLPFQRLNDDDGEVLSRVLAASGVTEGVTLAATPAAPDLLVGVLGKLDLMVGMRMHSLLLSLAAGTPFVGLPYSPKVDEVIATAGMEEYAHPVEGLDPQAVVASCEALLANREEAQARLAQGRERLREMAAISQEMAKALLKTGRAPAPQAQPRTSTRSARGIRVLMQIRPDFREVPGGDVVQLEEMLPYLRELGVTAELSGEESPDLADWDLVHTINLDRPEEPYRHCLNALAQGKPIAVSTVHADLNEQLVWADTDYWHLPDPAEGPPEPRPAPPQDPIELRRRALRHLLRQAIIDWGTVYLPNAEMNAEYLHHTFGLDLSRSIVVPNGVRETFFGATPDLFVSKYGLRDFVLCVGRVETKKNQLSLIAALRGEGIPLVIVGRPNPQAYYDLCRRYADGNVHFMESLSEEELASAYAAAKVSALPSWIELPGITTLEAAAVGCNIVSTDRGSPPEYLKDMAWYCDPRSLDSIRQAVRAAYAAPRADRLKEHVRAHFTWRIAAERTREGYELALDLHASRSPRDQQETAASALKRHCDWLERLAADRHYEVQRYQQMYSWADGARQQAETRAEEAADLVQRVSEELRRGQEEFARVTSRRLYRWSGALARSGWGILRVLGIKR
jgi:polysaccharide pyruvyl transferase WcaK-like protein/glycosyltransferase involved in cell wall biosynthesis